jgi:hypothetical protein
MQAEIRYTAETGEKLVNETFGPNNIHRRTSGSDDRRRVEIRDGRLETFSLDGNGFALVPHATQVGDFLDEKQLKGIYYPEVEALVRQVSGAARVVVFDHTLRSGDEAERAARLLREPVLSAHNDYTEWSGPNRVREVLPDEAEALVFKVYDSERDGRARFTPHTSFEDPSTPPGAPPRQSIEVRTLAFF